MCNCMKEFEGRLPACTLGTTAMMLIAKTMITGADVRVASRGVIVQRQATVGVRGHSGDSLGCN